MVRIDLDDVDERTTVGGAEPITASSPGSGCGSPDTIKKCRINRRRKPTNSLEPALIKPLGEGLDDWETE